MSELDVLLSERAITRVLLRYARGIDRRDFDLIRSAYWPDAYDEHGEFEGDVDAYVAWLEQVLPQVTTSTHQFTNILVDVAPGDARAKSEAYCLNVNVFGPHEGRTHHMTSGLRYLDDWERRGEAWRIVRRRVITDWTRMDEAPTPRLRRTT